jgi:hypothetical protein
MSRQHIYTQGTFLLAADRWNQERGSTMSTEGTRRRCTALALSTRLAPALLLLAASAAPGTAAAQSWQPVGPPAVIEALAVGAAQSAPAAPGTLYASVMGAAGVFHSADGGATWVNSGNVFAAPFGGTSEAVYQLVADPQAAGTAYAVTAGALFKTTDGGVSWQTTPTPVPVCGANRLVIAPSQPSRLYAVGIGPLGDPSPPCLFGGVVSSSDGGATFSLARSNAAPFTALAVDPADPNRIYVASPSTMLIYTSDDGGATLTALPPLPSAGEQVVHLAVDASTTPSTLLAAVNISDPFEQAVFRAQPGAAAGAPFWTQPASGLPAGLQVTDFAIDSNLPSTVYAASDRGVFLSPDHGITWTPQNDGLSSLQVAVLALDPALRGPLYAGTGAGLDRLGRGGCQLDATSACLDGARFKVAVTYQLDEQTFTAQAVQLSDDTTAFWFFDASNYELMVKVLDGSSVNGDFWIFSGGLSSVEYTVTVTDILTGTVKTYPKAAGILQSFADTSAFPAATPAAAPPHGSQSAATTQYDAKHDSAAGLPAGHRRATPRASAGTCTAGATDLCLLAARFKAEITFDGGSVSGNGQAISLTGDTGSFWFLAPDNFEVTVKILDGTAVNGRFWVFYGAMTNFAFTLTLTDTTNGAVRTYVNPAGTIASLADTSAF